MLPTISFDESYQVFIYSQILHFQSFSQTADSTDDEGPAFAIDFVADGDAVADLDGFTSELGGSNFFNSFFKLLNAWDNFELLLLLDFTHSPTSCRNRKILFTMYFFQNNFKTQALHEINMVL